MTEDVPGGGAPSQPLQSVSLGGATLVGAYLYFTGWCYTYYYYRALGITAEVVDVPLQHVIALSFTAVFSSAGTAAVVAVVIIITYAFYRAALANGSMTIVHGVAVIGLGATFAALWIVASISGNERAAAMRNGYGAIPVEILQSASESLVPVELIHAGSQGQLWLIHETETRLYLLNQTLGSLPNSLPMGHVYVVRQDNVTVQRRTILRDVPRR